ncbi:MAG: hypothetical protein LBC11_00180 [Puniceicoccales bacterium]|jgi:hypothetical protein|nr:hypothetical protein [Puniceicoccales bacterium]
MDVRVLKEQGDIIEGMSGAGNEFGITGTSNARFQDQIEQMPNTTLSSRLISKGKEIYKTKGKEICKIAYPIYKAGDALRKKDWVKLAASGVSFIYGVLSKASTTSIGKKPGDDLGQVVDNFVAEIDDRGIQESVKIAVDVLTHPEKHRDFEEVSGGDGPKFGKKDTLRKIKSALEELNGMSGPTVDSGKAILTAAKKLVHLKLKLARAAKAAKYAAMTASIAVSASGIAGAVVTGGASLVPTVVKFAASGLNSACNVARTAIEEMHAGMTQQTGGGGFLYGDEAQLEARGIKLTPDALRSLRECNGLAIDVLTHPEKNRNFEGPGDTNFGKKDTKRILRTALKKFDEWTQDVTDPNAQEELTKLRQDILTALAIVSSKLNKARGMNVLKISGAILGTAVAGAACALTGGAALPIVGAVLGAVGAVVKDGTLIHELWKNRKKHKNSHKHSQ